MTQGVKEFLRSLSLERYYDMFLAKGFDLESDICNLDTTDLDSMYISEDRHRKQILEAGRSQKIYMSQTFQKWYG